MRAGGGGGVRVVTDGSYRHRSQVCLVERDGMVPYVLCRTSPPNAHAEVGGHTPLTSCVQSTRTSTKPKGLWASDYYLFLQRHL